MFQYKCLKTAPITKMMPVAADVNFAHAGANLVYRDANGHITVAGAATATIVGIVTNIPEGVGAGIDERFWKSRNVAGVDYLPVIEVRQDYLFLLPADDTVTQSMVGNAADLVLVSTIPQVDVGTSVTEIFIIKGLGTELDGTATDVIVQLNPAKIQAD